MRFRIRSIVLGIMIVMGCGDDDIAETDAGATDGASQDVLTEDAGAEDAGAEDARIDIDIPPPVDAGRPPADWACLGDVPATMATPSEVEWFIHMRELVGSADAAGLTVRACARDDDECASPLFEAVTDSLGNATLTLPLSSTGFDGYLEINGEGVVPSLALVVPSIVEGNTAETASEGFVLRQSQLELVGVVVSTMVDPTRGHILVEAHDCAGNPNEGATLTTQGQDEGSVTFYTDETVGVDPSLVATSTSGTVGVFNVIPGRHGVRVDHRDGYVGGRDDVPVRAGHLTGLVVAPSNDYGSWACLGSVPPRDTPTEPMIRVAGRVVDIASRMPIEGVVARICALDDTGCESPLVETTTDASGLAEGMVPAGTIGFDGFIELQVDGYTPTIAFFTPPIIADMVEPVDVAIATEATFDIVALSAGVTLDDARGHVAVRVGDCGTFNRTGVGGSVIADIADDESALLYLDGALPSRDATETLNGGIALYFNLPAGPLGDETPVTYSSTEVRTSMAAGTETLFVRAGWVHQLTVVVDPT